MTEQKNDVGGSKRPRQTESTKLNGVRTKSDQFYSMQLVPIDTWKHEQDGAANGMAVRHRGENRVVGN